MPNPPLIAKLKSFCITGSHGGTIVSDMAGFSIFTGEAAALVDSGFWDYETGWRFRGTAHSEDLKAYQALHGGEAKQVFFGRFDLFDSQEGDRLAQHLGLAKSGLAG